MGSPFTVYELYVERELWFSYGILKREDSNMNSSSTPPILCENAMVSANWTPSAKKQSNLTTHACKWNQNDFILCKHLPEVNTTRPADHQDVCFVVWRWESNAIGDEEGKTLHVHGTATTAWLWLHQCYLLHGNCVACGVSCLCSAVNPVLYSINMLSSPTFFTMHMHIRVLWSVLLIITDCVCIKKWNKNIHSFIRWGPNLLRSNPTYKPQTPVCLFLSCSVTENKRILWSCCRTSAEVQMM